MRVFACELTAVRKSDGVRAIMHVKRRFTAWRQPTGAHGDPEHSAVVCFGPGRGFGSCQRVGLTGFLFSVPGQVESLRQMQRGLVERQGGPEALLGHPSPGHPPKLSSAQKASIPEFLWHGAE